jgi:catechol 2,3-dioxygenase-like lactoylglutathione lyase family enzyme
VQADGYLFVELYVSDVAYYTAVFRDVLGLAVVEDDGGFVKLRSPHATVMLNDGRDLAADHPFADFPAATRRGVGVELGFVVRDLDRARAAALAIPGQRVSEVTHQEWGMSDFRVLTREGYYLRVTTPDPEAG